MTLLPEPREQSLTSETVPADAPIADVTVDGMVAEGYVLTIDPAGIRIGAADAAGAFYRG